MATSALEEIPHSTRPAEFGRDELVEVKDALTVCVRSNLDYYESILVIHPAHEAVQRIKAVMRNPGAGAQRLTQRDDALRTR